MDTFEAMRNVFKALADVNRLRIVEVLTQECKSVNDIAEAAQISQPLASHHLKVLKRSRIARMESRGTFNYY